MQFPFGLILLRVGNARGCPNSGAEAEQCWSTGRHSGPQDTHPSARCACPRDGMENIRGEWFHRNTASVTVSAALAAVMCRTRCVVLCGEQGWGMRDGGGAESMPLRVMCMSWEEMGRCRTPRDGGSSRIQPLSEHPYSCKDCSVSEGRAEGVTSQPACEVLISLLIISTNFLPFRDVQNKPCLSRSVLL